MKRLTATLALYLLCLTGVHGEIPQNGETVAPVLSMPAMNVFRRHTVPSEEMFWFYGEVLGLQQLSTYAVGNGGVSRFVVGASQLKLTGREAGREYVAGGVDNATGLRLITFFFPDQTALEKRFREHALPVPEFTPYGEGMTTALVQDPDGQWLQLVAAPGQADSFYEQLEVGLTVSDMAASRRFYADFLGLDALPATHDPLFDTSKYSYRNGSTIISLRQLGEDLPRDTGSAGIQYVVSDIHKVNELVQEYNITVDQALSELEGFNMLFLWVDDPDGITNYFAQSGTE